MPADCEDEFFEWLQNINCDCLKVYAVAEGSVAFPREPLLRVEGPLGVAQLVETALLNLMNYPSLVATCAERFILMTGETKRLLEFGLRRAQGPDGAISASKYSIIGGFDGTSNVLAGQLFDLSVAGTHGHAYIMSYITLKDLKFTTIPNPKNKAEQVEFLAVVYEKRRMFEDLGFCKTNDGELAAFVSYAQSLPSGFLALVDTYDTLTSGVKNFITVSLALIEIGYTPRGIRLDSGDLGYLSVECRKLFREIDQRLGQNWLGSLMISASNDINERVLAALDKQGHEIDCFGIGTHLVTCQSQPALGCVYKLVEVKENPRIKLSQEIEKLVIPCRKAVYRLYGREGNAILDVIQKGAEAPPEVGKPILCRHPFDSHKTCTVTPSRVEELLTLLWENGSPARAIPSIGEVRQHRADQIAQLRADVVRPVNPTPYMVSLSEELFQFMHSLWQEYAPKKHFE
jgi:nicotinate phosphoribosyltransferase